MSLKISAKINFKLSGLDVPLVNRIGLYNSSEAIIQEAQANAPVLTGKLKQSIAREPANITNGVRRIRIGPRGNPLKYAIVREFENKKNPGKRFYMRRTASTADKIVRDEFGKAIEIAIKNRLKTGWRKLAGN